MITALELAALRASINNKSIVGIDSETGNNLYYPNLMQLSAIPTTNKSAFYYNASSNVVYVMHAGAVLRGINFGSATVRIIANNVTVENCTFSQTSGYYSLVQAAGNSGATVRNCTFTTNGVVNAKLAAFVSSVNTINITNNSFIDAAGDAIDIGAGVVSGNFFSTGGYNSSGIHPDAIWVTASTGPTLIENNFIDWTNNPNNVAPDNDCIRITAELGNVSNVTVTGNYLIGGSSVVDAGNAGPYTFSNINISNNYIGFGAFFNFYDGPQKGVTKTNNVIIDFTNPVFSATAWTAYLAAGIGTNSLATASSDAGLSASKSGTTTLYGAGITGVHLYGGSSETIYVGGAGVQYMWGGSGKNIYSYLAISDSTVMKPDGIGNFHVATDVIDLHAINASPFSSTTTNFAFIGSAAFSGAGGQVRVVQDVANNQTLVQADLVGDSTADLSIRVSGLLDLTAANFALTDSQYNADIAGFTTVASLMSAQSSLDQVAAGVSVVDTIANVTSKLAPLQAASGHIKTIELIDGGASVSTATFAANQPILNKIAGGFAIADSVANIQAHIAALATDADHIKSVTLSDSLASSPAVLTLSAAAAESDAAILAKITSPFVLRATANGTAVVTGHGNGLTIKVGAGDSIVTGGGTSETFYLSSHFGSMQITDFAPTANSAKHDTISLSTTDFANWTTLLSTGHASGANNADTTFVASDGAALTLVGVSLSSLQHASPALKADFTFHA